ncbi:MAG: helix-turn-helix transcriptional regulator [Chloroflexota bacterium]
MPIHPEDLHAVASLDEPARRSLYEWVAASGRAVGRDEAAAAVGVSRALAAFHLDRLVTDGLLVPEYRRLTGRTGPGAGRPAKLYRRAPREVSVTLPERRYETAARLFAETLDRVADAADGPPLELRDAARGVGEASGTAAAKAAKRPRSRPGGRAAIQDALRDRGYEPFTDDSGDIRLRNCPYHALVDEHRPLVCGMNLAIVEGVVEGVGATDLEARLDTQPGLCCVAIRAEAG